MRMTADQVAAIVGARVLGDASVMLLGAEVDSRRVREGDLFVALPGARRDGHEFVASALNTSAAAMVLEGFELDHLPADRALIPTRDPLASYHALAKHERSRRPWTVAALTGSVGKTTTKDFLAHLLAGRYLTGASQGNRNSTLGLPAQLLRQEPDIEVFVAEAGMSRQGELDQLGDILQPNLLLYTRIAPAHTEFFPDIAAVAQAKAELIAHLQPEGLLVINDDDPFQQDFPTPDVTTVRYGTPEANTRVESIRIKGLLGTAFDLVIENEKIPVSLNVSGLHQVENYLAAATAAWTLGVPVDEIASRAQGLQPAPHRGKVHTIRGGVTLVDDSYNASPLAMRRLLELLAASPGRHIAVLGEMYELGDRSEAAHRDVGVEAARVCDLIVAVGNSDASILASGAIEAGMESADVIQVGDAAAAAEVLDPRLETGDVVLIKGSRGVGLDRTVELLIAAEAP